MASRSIRQAIVLLASVSGALQTVRDEQMIGNPDLVKELHQAIKLSNHAVATYPDLGATAASMAKDERWIVDKMVQWKKLLDDIPRRWEYFVLISIAYQAAVDLLGRLRDKSKIALVEPILAPLEVISDFSDPLGRNEAAFVCADETLSSLYGLVGFRS